MVTSTKTTILGIRIVNKGDKIERQQYSFTGLPEVYDSMMMDVAGAARIPVTKLFGRSPAGLNATGESDLQNYYDYIDELRESTFRPIVDKLLPVLAMSAWGMVPEDLDVTFESIRTAPETEKAEIIQKKVAALLDLYSANGIPKDVLLQGLRNAGAPAGMFSFLHDDLIAQSKGTYARDDHAMADPFAGITLPQPLEGEA